MILMMFFLFWADISVRMQLPFQTFSIYLAVDFLFEISGSFKMCPE
jgi:hypothetical protein